MTERSGEITFMGNPLTLLGDALAIGENVPDVTLLDNELNPVNISDFKGKVVIIATVPSLDTPVCDMEARRFNAEAANLGDDIVILAVSMDLPFAQARWCGAAGVEQVKTLSDHRDAALGEGWGVLIKELRLLARAVFIIDKNGALQYEQLVSEVTEEPDYDEALNAAKDLV